jgi:hypothetical protein
MHHFESPIGRSNTHPEEAAILEFGADLAEAVYPLIPYRDEIAQYIRDSHPIDNFVEGVSRGSTYLARSLDPLLDYFSPTEAVREDSWYLIDDELAYAVPPASPLVGVELNPGPPKQHTKPFPGKQPLHPAPQKPKVHGPTNLMPSKPKGHKQHAEKKRHEPTGAAAAYSSGLSTSKPTIIRTKDDTVVIKHTELVHLVQGTVAYGATSIPIQPGLPSTFTWLATQCNGWEKYRFRSLKAVYYTRTGTNASGSLMLVPDYDAADSPPADARTASSFHGCADDAPWKTISCNFDMKRSRELFLRYGPLTANLDIKTYDFANLYICTGDGSAIPWGKVYLEYEIELLNPQAVSVTYAGGSIFGSVGTTPANVFGTTPSLSPGANVVSVTAVGSIALTNLVVGQEYFIYFNVVGTGITALATTLSSGLVIKNQVNNDLINAGGTVGTDATTCIASASSGVLILSATATTVTIGQMTFTPVNATF